MIQNKTGINNYDNAMLNKVKSWFPNTIFANTAITYNVIFNLMDAGDRKLKVPLINIYRPNGFQLVPIQTFAARQQGGLMTEYNLGARHIAVNLMYQFDIYAKTPEDVNTMAETLIKTFNFYPTISITHKDSKTKKEFTEQYEIEYLSGPTDQAEFDNDDRVYRYYLQYEIKNAKLYDFTDYSEVIETDLKINDNEV